tara:strand:+ start:2157 stop:3620 length:1464 start_codon:yes stop_codon:yes gene_type:complete
MGFLSNFFNPHLVQFEECRANIDTNIVECSFNLFANILEHLVWGPHMLFMILGAGTVFTLYFKFPQFRFFRLALQIVSGKYDNPEDKGEISHFKALCTALSATVGLGNIAGVAIAITLGGPGAVFWMWVAGFLGMATKFTEVTLALRYRNEDSAKHMHGGPMFTILNGLGKNWKPVAAFYAFACILSSFGAGNMFQSNQMSSVLVQQSANMFGLEIPSLVFGITFATLAGLVLIGGIKRIADVTSFIVPFMVVVYFIAALGILTFNLAEIPAMFGHIFHGAFNGTAAVGGFSGAVFKEVLKRGLQRGTFSNEAGMGSSAMAHSAAKSRPAEEGTVALLEPFIDTIVVCTITALAILVTGSWHTNPGITGSELTAFTFAKEYGQMGAALVAFMVTLFAFSTIISWSYYGEQGIFFLFGENQKAITIYRVLFLCATVAGSYFQGGAVVKLSDAFFGLMAFPNLIACVLLLKFAKLEVNDFADYIKSKKS